MPSPVENGTSARQASSLGLPEGLKIGSAFPFAGLNRAASRIGIKDSEFYWLENYVHIGEGRLRTVGDVGDTIYRVPSGRTIISFFWFNIGPRSLVAVFLDDGTGWQVDPAAKNAVTAISATPDTFGTADAPPACASWGTRYLIISNNLSSDDYWLWDGTLLYGGGGIAPDIQITSGGENYFYPPSVTAYGGSGSGATFAVSIVNGSVVTVTPTSVGTGYGPADVVQLQFSGGGSDTSAILQAVLQPNGVAAITVAQGGAQYASPPDVTLTGGGGSGAVAVANVINGRVISVAVLQPGSGYTSTPAVNFSGGGGSGAVAAALLGASTVASVNVVNGGNNYTGTPVLTFEGGGGSGAQATAVVTNGVITSATITNAGSGYTAPPAIVVQPGVNHAAAALVPLMPIRISGSAVETFQSRVWLLHPYQAGPLPTGGDVTVSAPGSLTDFATSDGGLLFENTDRFLRSQYTFARQANGYLYLVGDSSVSVVSNVQTSGSPATTSFNLLPADPQTGSCWRDSTQDFAKTILFANPFGVFGIYGGTVTKVSRQIDTIFHENAILPQANGALVPTAAVAELYDQRLYLLLLRIKDPLNGLPRTVMLGWDEKEWAVYSQSVALSYIGTREQGSNLVAWGTDGSTLRPLFQTPSTALAKTLQTKYYGGETAFIVGTSYAIYVTATCKTGASTLLAYTTRVDSIGVASPVTLPAWMSDEVPLNGGSYTMSVNPVALQLPATGEASFGTTTDPPIAGTGLGLTMTTTCADYELNNLQLGYIDVHAII